MPDSAIVLSTITARYTHTAFGLRWLWANLGAFREHTVIREFHLKQTPLEIAEQLLAMHPRIVGLGAYIWNVAQITQVAQIIKAVRPDVVLVVGGPEASHEFEGTPLFETADYLVRGEGERAFADLVAHLMENRRPETKVISLEPPDLSQLAFPYDAYSDTDLARRLIYVEASRGCPFHCEFCLSSLDTCVREFPLDPVLAALDRLIQRGARNLIFVDRTFNLKASRVETILHFLKARWHAGLLLHFEIVPDRLTKDMQEIIATFPPGALHLEVGVQTFNPEVQEAISRRQDMEKTIETLRFLRTQTGALLHADLIVGLPGESWESFASGFNQLLDLAPHAIQVGILKRLKGTPIARHTVPHAMAFSQHPPYEILQTDCLKFDQVQRLKRFARFFDLYYNSDNFPQSLALLWRTKDSPFEAFMALSDAIWTATGRTHEFPLSQLARLLYHFLIEHGTPESEAAAAIHGDFYRTPGRTDKLDFLRK